MFIEKKTHQLIEEIELFIQYAVPKEQLQQAISLLHRYKNNAFVTRLFREYYSCLPEAREEAVARIARLVDRQGVHLFVVTTASFSYLYAVSVDHVLLIGEYQKAVDTEVLSFFEMESQEAFLKICPAVEDLAEFEADEGKEKEMCPVCAVAEGDCHLLGCTVETCPWCTGQLSYCNCRFEHLKTDSIADEEQLEAFIELLTAKGRIPYHKSQAPAFPGTSGGLDDNQTTK